MIMIFTPPLHRTNKMYALGVSLLLGLFKETVMVGV